MRIIDKARFAIGIIDLVGGTACVIACILLHRGTKTVLAFVPIICGIASLMQSIETKAKRQKRKEELMKMFGGSDK